MSAERLLAESAADLITWQERLLSPLIDHRLQLLCSVVVGALLGLLGGFVVLRRMSLIGDAIAHAVLPGVVIAFLLVSTGVTGLFVGALAAGVVTAVAISLVTRFSRAKEDAAIGIVFTAMFAVGVILISRLPAGTHFDLKCFLFGDPLAITETDWHSILLIAPVVVGTILLLFHPLKLLSFDPVLARTMGFNTSLLHYVLMILLSATIVAALRSVGVIMAVAMLVTPAATAYQLTNRLWLLLTVSTALGGLSAAVGMFLAFQFNNPPGPMMVLVATVVFLLAMALAPERGFLAVALRRRRIRRHILEEDVLKMLARFEEAPQRAGASLAAALTPADPRAIGRAVEDLARDGLVTRGDPEPTLTSVGRARAQEMLRAHRLWETYLAQEGAAERHLHDEAERLEHAHELAEELDRTLGRPAADPQGKTIPRPEG